MTRARLAFAALVAVCLVLPCAAAAQSVPPANSSLGGIAFDEHLDRESVLLASLPRSTADLPPLIARLSLDVASIPAERLTATLADLDRRLAAYAARNVLVVLSLGAFPASDDAVETWRAAVRSVAERGRSKVTGYQIGAAGGDVPPPVDRYVFLLKLASVQLRSADVGALVIEGAVPATFDQWQSRLYDAGIAPYVDAVAIAGPPGADDDAFRESVRRMTALVIRQDSSSSVILGPLQLPAAADAATARFVEAEFRSLDTPVKATSFTGTAIAVRGVLAVAARAADLFAGNLVAIDERAAALRLSRNGSDVTASVPHRFLFSTTRLATYLVYESPTGTSPLDVDVNVPGATTPQVRDVLSGTSQKPMRAETRDKTVTLTVPAARHPLVIDFNADAVDRFVETTTVQTNRLPSVEEIIARHQQAQAAQDAALTRYIAHMRIEQHLHPSAADIGYNLVTENRVFFERGSVEWEELSFSFNGAKWIGTHPSFPLVQPEKVLSVPLDLRLTEDYTYELDGVDTVMGRPAFVVRFEPRTSARALYRGTVWIDRELFVRLKVHAVESNLSGMVVSNDEVHTFNRIGDLQGRPIWLLDRLSSKQTFLIAGRTVLVEREAKVSDVAMNPEAFEAERTEARSSNRIMYRDTEQGLRYLVKRGTTRVVSNQVTTSTKAFALGAQVDPSFDYPLPIGGLDVLDFNFLDKDMQFALLFAGVFAAGNIQKPNLWGRRLDASVDFFGLAVGSNDAVFDPAGERQAERVRRVPGATGVNLGYQASAFQKIIGHYEFKYDAYFRDPKTAEDFTLPSNAGTHGIGVGYEYRRAGYSLIANAMKHRRTSTNLWGPAGALVESPQTFSNYDVGLSKDFIFATFHTIHLNGAYFGGNDLDRFSMYQFGLFDAARMHGVPSSVRFAELAMFRGSYSFNLFDQYRVDLFADHARGRDPQSGDQWMPVTGVGLGLNLRTPRNTILRADLGKSFLPDIYRGTGSVVLQIMLLKPL